MMVRMKGLLSRIFSRGAPPVEPELAPASADLQPERPFVAIGDVHGRVVLLVELDRLIAFVCARVGHRYDMRNILDLARYLLPLPPVPTPWRRHMLGLGSGDPTRAICSTLIAEAFQSVRYPILPIQVAGRSRVFRRRHHSLFTPRDFDLSPWFEVVKPRLVGGFDPHALAWQEST
jgi:hypothetical protein